MFFVKALKVLKALNALTSLSPSKLEGVPEGRGRVFD